MKRTAAAVATILVATSAAPAAAQPRRRGSTPSRADELLRVGLARYDAGDFAGAVAAFEEGYAVEPRPTFLFAAAQAERRSGDCPRAIELYDRFLATSPSESQAEAARDQRARCEPSLPPEPVRPAEPEIQPARPRPAPDLRVEARPWYADPVTDGLIAGSAILIGTGAGFSMAASSAADDANAADTYASYGDAASRASRNQTIGLVAFAGGVALGAVAIWRMVRHEGRSVRERAALGVGPAVGPGVDSGVLYVRGTF